MNEEMINVAEEVTTNASVNGRMILGGLAVAGLGAGVYALGQFIYKKIKEKKPETPEVAEEAAVKE